jgi:hypothetical protein
MAELIARPAACDRRDSCAHRDSNDTDAHRAGSRNDDRNSDHRPYQGGLWMIQADPSLWVLFFLEDMSAH